MAMPALPFGVGRSAASRTWRRPPMRAATRASKGAPAERQRRASSRVGRSRSSRERDAASSTLAASTARRKAWFAKERRSAASRIQSGCAMVSASAVSARRSLRDAERSARVRRSSERSPVTSRRRRMALPPRVRPSTSTKACASVRAVRRKASPRWRR